ncbi:condensin-2 complex subunit D3-like [Ceratina calcarata]|uniref:Condensin-2 complex subunit D3-like n=1 Tax=Ceratina calcarata TaxID=156304 RepID=A0AAJ7S4A0_9HYME|nr:condensin-2 complex subunit D3-like [Ceratina calcarata]
MECLRVFDNFKLRDLNEDWIQSAWDGDFMIFDQPPDEHFILFENGNGKNIRLLLDESCTAIRAWLERGGNENNSDDCHSEISWATLFAMDVKVRALLAVLGYIINNGQNSEVDEESRESCFLAINLYFLLLAIPGSSVFNVFHTTLYQRAIETLRIYSEQLQPSVKNYKKTMNSDDTFKRDETMNETVILSSHQRNVLKRYLNIIICNFIIMAKSFCFKDHVQLLDTTVHGILEVTRIEDECVIPQSFNEEASTVKVSLLHHAYEALRELCDSKHGPVKTTIMLIAKYMLPRLLCSPMDAHVKNIASIRDHTIIFLKTLLDLYEKESETAILILIQRMMLKCPDRLELRQKQAGLLLKIFTICTESTLLKSLKDLILLSHHTKIPFRIFAQEIIGKLLLETSWTNSNINDNLKDRIKRVLFAIALSRCMDCSSLVRGKAMAVIAEYSESDHLDKGIFQIMIKEPDENKKFVTFSDMKDALFNNADLLPRSNSLITMLLERLEDERALVRRSTLQLFKNLIIMFPSLIHDVVPAISTRCRDPAVTVRRFAVQVLSQLLQKFPNNTELLREWVGAVVPQIFDIEPKVQEKVLDHLQELLFLRIKDVSKCKDSAVDDLPWRILNSLANEKMRKHLSKACNLWAKNGIKQCLIQNIQSHIGTNNDIEAWILLAALAENTTLPNMNEFFSKYEDIVIKNDFRTNLILHVLSCSWKSVDYAFFKPLGTYLYKCLEEFKINYGLISVSLDIIHNTIAYLFPENHKNVLKSQMINLIQISEAEIAKVFNSKSEAAQAASNYVKAMFTLGHATILCTSKIKSSTLRILQGVLLKWEALPTPLKEINELQAATVVVLGQQAIRDREIAKQVAPIFGKLMRKTDPNSMVEIALKINVAKALADICANFTTLVEPYLPDMCVSMKDSSPKVREAIMVIFIQLLLEDYIKIKGPFFFHILTMLSDSDDMIRELTVFLIEERLLRKNKTLISQQFLLSIYHYNNCYSQRKMCRHKLREEERKVLTLPGKENEDKRRTIYDFMLDHLNPPEKIKILEKVTSQILGGTCADTINVNLKEGSCVLEDALYIISNDRLRPSSFTRHSNDDQQEGEGMQEAQTTTPASGAINVIVEGIKKYGLEILLPTLIKLRIKLSNLKLPVENDVRRNLVKTYSEYNKEQLTNLLNEYPQLEKEVDQFKKQLRDIRFNGNTSIEEEIFSPETDNQRVSDKSSDLTSPMISPTVGLECVSISELSDFRPTPVNCSSPHSILNGWDPLMCSTLGPSTSGTSKFSNLDIDDIIPSKIRKLSNSYKNDNGSANHGID